MRKEKRAGGCNQPFFVGFFAYYFFLQYGLLLSVKLEFFLTLAFFKIDKGSLESRSLPQLSRMWVRRNQNCEGLKRVH